MTTINIKNLSKEQLEALELQIAEAKKVLTTSYGRKRVEEWERYYYIDTIWKITWVEEDNHQIDVDRFNMWNYYLTEEEAGQARDRQLAIVRVNDAIDKLNKGWEPNYNTNDYQYYIGYDYKNSQKFELYWDVFTDYQNIIKPLRWNDNLFKEFSSEYEDDLNLIFNIK